MFGRVLLAVDGSEASGRAASVARELAKGLGSEVTVFHVREKEVVQWGTDAGTTETADESRELVDRVVRDLKDAGVSAAPEIRTARFGRVAKEIVKLAEELRPGLIVMGSRGLSEFAALPIGSVAYKVLHATTFPVLVVR